MACSLTVQGMYRSRYRFFQEGVHGCSENTHLLDPGPWDGGFRRPLALTSTVGGTCVHVSILMAGRFPPSPAGSGALSLVCGSVHLHWKVKCKYVRAGLPLVRASAV